MNTDGDPGSHGEHSMRSGALPGMGYQPSLDGLRALSVVLVMLYHAGVVSNAALPAGVPRPWFFNGGFLGVEVFFVVSGYLITTLLLEERSRSGTVSLRKFWGRRFRRLIPALWTMVVVASVWAMLWGHGYLTDLRHDVPFGLTYTSNFQQLFRKVSYFEGLPHLLRHLWSLAVEEHFYLLFPPVLWFVLRKRWYSQRRLLHVVIPAAVLSVLALALVWQRPVYRLTDSGAQLDDLRQNWAYLSTATRVGGILIGVALAVVWSPWARRSGEAKRVRAVGVDVVGVLAIAGVVVAALTLSNESEFLYRGGLTLVSLLSAVAIAMSVHPGARLMHALFGNRVMAAIGRRSYGLYLWHWPIFVGPLAGRSTGVRLLIGLPATAVVSELCYRFIETPVRTGAVLPRMRKHVFVTAAAFSVAAAALAVGLVVVHDTTPGQLDAGESAGAVLPEDSIPVYEGVPGTSAVTTAGSTKPSTVVSSGAGGSSSTSTAPTTTLPLLPRRVVAVGDSTAGAFARNAPKNIWKTLRFFRGELSGCSVNSSGIAVGVFKTGRDFRVCKGWQGRWSGAAKAAAAEIAIVIIGAWDVFGIQYGDHTVDFGSLEFDATFSKNLRSGIDGLIETGAKVALLETPCYRPHFTGGPGTFVFPERGDDAKTRHVDQLLRNAAAADPQHVYYITGPKEWCANDAVSMDYSYRYDGVHYTPRGALLVYKAIRDQLLAIPVDEAQHAKRPRS